MKILFISPSFFPATHYGGPIYSTYEFAKELKKQDVDIRVITTNANGKEKLKVKAGVFNKLENELSIKYYNSQDSRGTSLSMLFNLWRDIKESDLIYLISIFSPTTPLTIFLCKLYKKPIIISPRGQLSKWCLEQGSIFKKLWLRLFIQPFIHSVNHKFFWHLTSSAEQKSILSVYPSAQTFVIPNGVGSELFQLNDKKKDKSFYNRFTGFDCNEKKIIISMGRLQKVKGFDILIEAIGMIEKIGKIGKIEKQNVVLLIAGEDFGERKTLELMIDKLALRDRVFLIGMIEGLDKIEFLNNADLFALASHHENFGMVYAEALAAGTPVIASRNTPWQDVEKHNCGKWVENTTIKFARAINEILASDAIQMGKNGQKYVQENLSWGEITVQFKNQIEIILKNI